MKIFILFGCILLAACSNSKPNDEQKKDAAVTQTPINATDSFMGNESNLPEPAKEVIKVVKDFYVWYNTHFEEMNSYRLVSGCCDSSVKSPQQYRVNFSGASKFFSKLSQTNAFSPGFIKAMNDSFKVYDAEMLKDKQAEGPPYGFESDFFIGGQETGEILPNIAKAKFSHIKISDDTTSITMTVPYTHYPSKYDVKLSLVKNESRWLIDKIE